MDEWVKHALHNIVVAKPMIDGASEYHQLITRWKSVSQPHPKFICLQTIGRSLIIITENRKV